MTFDTLSAALLTAAFLVPGFIWSAVLSMLVPRRSTAEQHRLLEFLTLSCINYGLWSWLLFLLFHDGFISRHPYWSSLLLFVIVFASPIGLGLTSGFLRQRTNVALFLGRFGINTIHPIPTAWDYHFTKGVPYWVIVTLRNDSRVYGYFGGQSFAGDDPNERDMYIEAVFMLAPTGDWAPVEDSAGILIKAEQIAAIEFKRIPELTYGQ